MRNRAVFVLRILVAFFIGGTVANIDLIAEATGGNGDGAWAKLVARVTALEEKVTTLEENQANSLVFKQLADDANGNAAGWNPSSNPDQFSFDISDSDVIAESLIVGSISNNDGGNPPVCNTKTFDGGGGFTLVCGGQILLDGAVLNYVIISPVA